MLSSAGYGHSLHSSIHLQQIPIPVSQMFIIQTLFKLTDALGILQQKLKPQTTILNISLNTNNDHSTLHSHIAHPFSKCTNNYANSSSALIFLKFFFFFFTSLAPV